MCDSVKDTVSIKELILFLNTVPGTKGQEEVKKLGYGCEQEAERVIESMKNWKTFPYVKEKMYFLQQHIFIFHHRNQ